MRNPCERASLGEILSNSWVACGLKSCTQQDPLIVYNSISETDKECILQKMVDGKIASRDEILRFVGLINIACCLIDFMLSRHCNY